MKVAVLTNARTTLGANQMDAVADKTDDKAVKKAEEDSWMSAFNTAFKGGAVMGFTLCSMGLVVL